MPYEASSGPAAVGPYSTDLLHSESSLHQHRLQQHLQQQGHTTPSVSSSSSTSQLDQYFLQSDRSAPSSAGQLDEPHSSPFAGHSRQRQRRSKLLSEGEQQILPYETQTIEQSATPTGPMFAQHGSPDGRAVGRADELEVSHQRHLDPRQHPHHHGLHDADPGTSTGLGLGSMPPAPSSFYGHALTGMDPSMSGPAQGTDYPPFAYPYPSAAHSYHPTSPPVSVSALPLTGDGSESSRRHSLSDPHAGPSYAVGPASYPGPSSSIVPSGLSMMVQKASFDSTASAGSPPTALPGHHQHTPLHLGQPLPALGASTPPYPLATSARGVITVNSFFPACGAAMTPVSVSIGILPHTPHFIRGFRVMFGDHGTTTRVVGEKRMPDGEKVDLVASTPPMHLTIRYPGTSTCTLSLQALDENGNIADWADFGTFAYTDSPNANLLGSPRKRPGSPLSSFRNSPNTTQKAIFPAPDNSYFDSLGRMGHRRGHSRNSSVTSLVNGFGQMTHHSRNPSLASVSSDPDTLWNEGPPDPDLMERKPIARLRAPIANPSNSGSSTSTLRHPPIDDSSSHAPSLYRTTQLPTSSASGVGSFDGSPPPSASSTFVPIANKANLVFEGDLNQMAYGWSHDEWLVKRRLVQFWRRQEGNTITASFRPVALQAIGPNSIVISCIFREDKNECFVTSVDTIYVLEALVALRFTVEEKNRIRRNLEGFKPITISKGKPESEPFFKLIMGFPTPKPRNIEKDVKVFPWKILGPALRKIINKYSASYAPVEEIAAAGRNAPQPIGWKPGHTPPSYKDKEKEKEKEKNNEASSPRISPAFGPASAEEVPPTLGALADSFPTSTAMHETTTAEQAPSFEYP